MAEGEEYKSELANEQYIRAVEKLNEPFAYTLTIVNLNILYKTMERLVWPFVSHNNSNAFGLYGWAIDTSACGICADEVAAAKHQGLAAEGCCHWLHRAEAMTLSHI